MNVLIANTQEFNPRIGGVEKVSNLLARELKSRGCQVYFVSCLLSSYSENYVTDAIQYVLPDFEYFSKRNVHMFSSICGKHEIQIILNQAGNVKEFTSLCAKVAALQDIALISAIHSNPYNRVVSLFDLKYTKICKKSYIYALRRLFLLPCRLCKIKKSEALLYQLVLKSSNAVVVLSKRYISELNKIVGTKSECRVLSISNPIVTKSEKIKQKKEKVVLFVGRLDFDHKRPDRMIEIWEKLFKKNPEWQLWILGDGEYRESIEAFIKRKQIKNIKMFGFSDPTEAYHKASILCVTSTIEGFPMVLVEGMSYGCVPIAFASFSAVYDIIENNQNGYIIPPYSLRKYANHLDGLMNDSKKLEWMQKNTYKIHQKFSLETIVDKWIRLFIEERKSK